MTQFDEAMDKLLKVPPHIAKAAMEQEKRERAERTVLAFADSVMQLQLAFS